MTVVENEPTVDFEADLAALLMGPEPDWDADPAENLPPGVAAAKEQAERDLRRIEALDDEHAAVVELVEREAAKLDDLLARQSKRIGGQRAWLEARVESVARMLHRETGAATIDLPSGALRSKATPLRFVIDDPAPAVTDPDTGKVITPAETMPPFVRWLCDNRPELIAPNIPKPAVYRPDMAAVNKALKALVDGDTFKATRKRVELLGSPETLPVVDVTGEVIPGVHALVADRSYSIVLNEEA